MRIGTLAFLLGILALQAMPDLPEAQWGLLLLVLPALAWWRWLRWPAAIAAGFLWALLHANAILATALPVALEGQDVVVEGVVASLPEVRSGRMAFVLQLRRAAAAGNEVAGPARVQLRWYRDYPALQPGEHWRLKVRLKRPHGLMNPGGFDYEGWLFRQGIRATGYVRTDPENRRLDTGSPWTIDRWRQGLLSRLRTVLVDEPQLGLILALAVGARDDISPTQWRVLGRTGTNHLMSISGLHIGLVAGLGFLVLRWAWAWAGRAPLRWPAPKAGVVGGLLCALVYSAFAGFALPTQRALIMLGVVATALLWGRHPSPSNTLAAALLLVLLADPLAVMSAGFWLSFAAVAVIMFSLAGRHSQPRGWRQGVRLQWLIALGLAPFTLWLFQQASLVAPLANGIAIPVVALLVVPLTLLGSLALPLIPTLGAWLLVAAAKLLGLLWPVLQWLASLPFALWAPPAPAPAALAAALVGVGLLLAPRGWPGRWLGGVWLLPLLWPTGSPIATGAARFTLLDSGQGLAAVVQTRHHVLVYDSGPRYGEQADAGERVVVPYLRAQGVTQVDLLLLSHGDSDHIGGAASIVGALPVQRLLGSEVERVAGRAVEPCGAGETWIWDQVTFRVLHPSPDRFESGNDASCVLQVATAGARLLIPGDLGFAGETALVNAHGAGLRSDILVAPHHGSQSSSGAAFAAAVAPRFVLFAAGHQNRFQFPRPAVVARYQAAGSVPLQTAESGAISFELGAQAVTLTPARYRDAAGRYWHRR